jgi:hypothetical protein
MDKKQKSGTRFFFSLSHFVTMIFLLLIIMMIILSSSSAIITKYIFSQQQAFGDVETIQRKPSNDRTILTTTSATISDFLLYENPTIGIKMEYPASWDKEEPIPNGVLFRFSPQNNISDKSSRYLLIMVNTMDPQDNMTLDELTDVQIDFLKESFPNLSLNEYESNTTTLAGNPAYKVIFDHKEGGRQQQGDLDFRLTQIWTIKGDKVYYITYREESGKQEDSDNYLKTIQKMIDSFQISDFLLYENPTIGVKMEYPIDWVKIEEEATQYNYLGSNNSQYPIVVGFLPPLQNNSDRFTENLTISVESVTQNTTLDVYTDVTVKLYNATNFDLVESDTTTTLAGSPAHKVIFESRTKGEENEANYKLLQIWTVKGGKAYRITFQADPERYSEILPIAQKMIDSFQISDFLLYENPTIGIKMEYPIDWQEKKAQDGSNVTFISPPQSNFDMYHANVTITTKSLSKNITLDQYGADIFINGLKKNATEFRIVEETPATIGGNNTAYKIVYITKDGQEVLKVMAFLTIKDDKVYLIEYRSEVGAYSNYLAKIQKMIDSIEIEIDSLTAFSSGFMPPPQLLGIPSPILPPLGVAGIALPA